MSQEQLCLVNKYKSKLIDIVISKNYSVDFSFNDKKAVKHLSKIATDPNYKYLIIIGSNEIANNSISVKNLITREQKMVNINDIENDDIFLYQHHN